MTHAAVVLEPAVRVTVRAGRQCLDIDLPGRVPLLELLPDLADRLGVFDQAALSGAHVTLVGGEPLDLSLGLDAQGVGVGDSLVLTVGTPVPPKLYDDPADAVADAAAPTGPSGRVVAAVRWSGVSTCLALGWLCMVALPSRGGQIAAAACALALLACSAFIASTAPAGALTFAWSAAAFAGLAGARIADDAEWFGSGLAVLVTSLVATAALDQWRRWLLPPAAVGATAAVLGVGSIVPVPTVTLAAACLVGLSALPPILPRVAIATLDPGDSVLDEEGARALAGRTRGLVDALHAAVACGTVGSGLLVASDLPGAGAAGVAAILLLLHGLDTDVRLVVGGLASVPLLAAATWTTCTSGQHGPWLGLVAVGSGAVLSAGLAMSGPESSQGSTRWRGRAITALHLALPTLALLTSGVLP